MTGMAYMFWWGPLVLHAPVWTTGGDLWGILRGAHYVGWGDLGGIYTPGNGVVTFPGMEVLLAPVAMVAGTLHLTESYGSFFLPHPTAALVLQPVELILASAVIFAADALAERLGTGRGRRAALCLAVSVVAWPVAAIWGHAEDLVAVSFAIYALIAVLDGRWARAGWLLGFGIAVQPLVALIVPLLIGASPPGRRLMLAVRSAAMSVVLVGIAFAGNPADTLRAVVTQPTPPSVNHATPWAAFSPTITAAGTGVSHSVSVVQRHGRPVFQTVTGRVHEAAVVSGGAGRVIDIVLAVLIGVFVWRRPQEPVRLLWMATLVLASRCFFEPVMTPYYLAPPLLLALVVAARQSPKRFWAAVVLALEITVFAYFHLAPWAWWLPVVVGLSAVVALGYPGSGREFPSADRRSARPAAEDRRDDVGPAGATGPWPSDEHPERIRQPAPA
ncbi:MAG: hypothetical protein ACYCVN_01265 [Acidimicrobiales bacterium]